jgi:hypothetical protein
LPAVGSYFADDVGGKRPTCCRPATSSVAVTRSPSSRVERWQARRHRALRARADNRRGRRGRLVLQASVLGPPDGERRDCAGVHGVLFEVPEASMSATRPDECSQRQRRSERSSRMVGWVRGLGPATRACVGDESVEPGVAAWGRLARRGAVARQPGADGLLPVLRARRSSASAARRRASAPSEARSSSRIRAELVGRPPYALALYRS